MVDLLREHGHEHEHEHKHDSSPISCTLGTLESDPASPDSAAAPSLGFGDLRLGRTGVGRRKETARGDVRSVVTYSHVPAHIHGGVPGKGTWASGQWALLACWAHR